MIGFSHPSSFHEKNTLLGNLVLTGGDEFRKPCLQMDRAVLKRCLQANPRIVIVPTAAAATNPSLAGHNGVVHFNGLGARTSTLMAVDRGDANNKSLLEPVDTADVIYITGGDPEYLHETLKESLLLTKLNEALLRGAVVAGSSAGAMVLGSWMQFNDWRKTFGIAENIAVMAHHEKSDPSAVSQRLAVNRPEKITVLGIDSSTCVIGGSHSWTVEGQGFVTVYERKGWARYSAGQKIQFR